MIYPKSAFEKITERLKKCSVFIVGPDGSGKSLFLEELFSTIRNKYKIVILPVNLLIKKRAEAIVKLLFWELNHEKDDYLPEIAIKKTIDLSKEKLLIFIDDILEVPSSDLEQLLKFFSSLWQTNREKVCFVFTGNNFPPDDILSLFGHHRLATEFLDVPPLQLSSVQSFIKEFNLATLSDKKIKKILKISAGNPRLIKQIIQIKNGRSVSLIKLPFFEKTWQQLSESQKETLRKILKKGTSPDQKIIRQLIALNILNIKNGFSTPLWQKFIALKRDTDPLGDEIIWRDKKIPLSFTFTETEFKVFKYLLDHQGKIINRTNLIEDIWSKDWELISDHLLDQLVFRVRKKIKNIKFPKLEVKTIRGRGHILTIKE